MKKILVVTEKNNPVHCQRDGGAMLVETLKRAGGASLRVMQFSNCVDGSSEWHFEYPFHFKNRFENRLANADFIAEKVKGVENDFSIIIFIHVSMQFGLVKNPLRKEVDVWTCPMFLTPSYLLSGEIVPEEYSKMEKVTLERSKKILTPSHLEKEQLVKFYSLKKDNIHVVPRGVNNENMISEGRFLHGDLKFCSIGSIKPQKNTVGLVRLFSKIRNKFKNAILKIIGPVQNEKYFERVLLEINRLNLGDFIEIIGYLSPAEVSGAVEDCHIHISASNCETFGRSIFETLSLGLPNVAKLSGNAAATFLKHVPYARFLDSDKDFLLSVEFMVNNFSKLSQMALEIGDLYDDKVLSKLLLAEICGDELIGISDFDGTLFHKESEDETQRSICDFKKFQTRVVCSARSVESLIEKMKFYDLEVDWIIGYSGAVVTDGNGNVVFKEPLADGDICEIEKRFPDAKRIEFDGDVVQMKLERVLNEDILGFRIEVYQNETFISNWNASKLRSVGKLLKHINWSGRVKVFGDGKYDEEMINYFDGDFKLPSYYKGYWMITNRCNLSCSYCVLENKSHQLRRELNLESKKEFVDHLYNNLCFRKLTLSGGEALIIGKNPPNDFIELLRHISKYRFGDRSKNLDIELYTNGTLMNERVVEAMEGVVDVVAVTIDSNQDKCLSDIGRNRVGQYYDNVVNLCSMLSRKNIKVKLHSVVSQKNHLSLGSEVKFILNSIKKEGGKVFYWKFYQYMSYDDPEKDLFHAISDEMYNHFKKGIEVCDVKLHFKDNMEMNESLFNILSYGNAQYMKKGDSWSTSRRTEDLRSYGSMDELFARTDIDERLFRRYHGVYR